jgi:hypothetical protein
MRERGDKEEIQKRKRDYLLRMTREDEMLHI